VHTSEYVPEGQLVHPVTPVSSSTTAYVPAGQLSSQADEPPLEMYPLGHTVHDVAPVLAL
jgi:hypothetical protein